jgi:hypothetical protein
MIFNYYLLKTRIGIVKCLILNDRYFSLFANTYKTADDMPENIRKALPDAEELIKLM